MDSIPGSERLPGEGRGNPGQYSCLGNPTDRGAGCATVHGISKESDVTERLIKTTRPPTDEWVKKMWHCGTYIYDAILLSRK